MPQSQKPPLSTLEMWMQQHPDEHQRNPYHRFLQIPAHITQSIQKSPVVKGTAAQDVWKTVANHLKNRHDPESVQYFARNGMFTNIAALCEDRLSSLFVHRSRQMYPAKQTSSMKQMILTTIPTQRYGSIPSIVIR